MQTVINWRPYPEQKPNVSGTHDVLFHGKTWGASLWLDGKFHSDGITHFALPEDITTTEAPAQPVTGLRQKVWDALRVMGYDTDGDETPDALVTDIGDVLLDFAKDFRATYDEALLSRDRGEGAALTFPNFDDVKAAFVHEGAIRARFKREGRTIATATPEEGAILALADEVRRLRAPVAHDGLGDVEALAELDKLENAFETVRDVANSYEPVLPAVVFVRAKAYGDFRKALVALRARAALSGRIVETGRGE